MDSNLRPLDLQSSTQTTGPPRTPQTEHSEPKSDSSVRRRQWLPSSTATIVYGINNGGFGSGRRLPFNVMSFCISSRRTIMGANRVQNNKSLAWIAKHVMPTITPNDRDYRI